MPTGHWSNLRSFGEKSKSRMVHAKVLLFGNAAFLPMFDSYSQTTYRRDIGLTYVVLEKSPNPMA